MLALEFQRLLHYRTAIIILILYAALFLLRVVQEFTYVNSSGLPLAAAYAFSVIWVKLVTAGTACSLLLVVLFTILITDDFQYRIFRQKMIDGATYWYLIRLKLIDSLLLASFSMLTVLLIGLCLGGWYASGTLHFTPSQFIPILSNGLQTMGFMSLAGLIAIIVRKSGLSIIIFSIYMFVGEPLLLNHLPLRAHRWLPCRAFFDLTPNMAQVRSAATITDFQIQQSTYLLPLAYILLFWSISYFLLCRQDL